MISKKVTSVCVLEVKLHPLPKALLLQILLLVYFTS